MTLQKFKRVRRPPATTTRALKARWVRRLRRLHFRLEHIEAAAECMNEFAERIDEWRTPALAEVIMPVWVHWYAVLLRGVYLKGGGKQWAHVNVSLEGFLEDVSMNPAEFIKAADRGLLEALLGKKPTEARLLSLVNRDRKAIIRGSKRFKRFADTIAHLQLRQRKIKGRRLGEARDFARGKIDKYHSILYDKMPPKSVRERLVDAFEADLNKISRSLLGFPA